MGLGLKKKVLIWIILKKENRTFKTISDFIEICETTNEELYLLKVFSEPEDYDDELHEFDFILLFKKIHSIILNSSKLTKRQLLVCSNIQRYVMWLYSEKLAHY